MAKKSTIEEAQASAWNEMERRLDYGFREQFVFAKPFDCSDEDYASYVEYQLEHM